MLKAAGKTDDDRLQALAAINVGLNGQQAYESASQLANGNLAGIKVSINLSNSQSKSNSSQSGQNVVGSQVAAGRDASIVATGTGNRSDLNLVGSSITAGRDINLKADGDINLLAAQNTAIQNGNNSNSGWSAGIGISLGQQNGFTLDLAANKGKGEFKGDAVSQSNSYVTAGNRVGLESGQDTTLQGAVITGEQVQADVAGNLNLASLQDTNRFKSEQKSAGAGVSICVPPFCVGTSSVSGSYSQQNMDSNYASVAEQSGIKVGDGGFQINVAGNTDLKGSVIASSEQAVNAGKNSLITGSLTVSDLRNRAEYSANSLGISGG